MAIEIVDTKIVHIETAFKGWGRYLIATIRLSDGRTFKREIEDHGAAIGVLAYDPERKVAMLVRQLRGPVLYVEKRQFTLELIAGIVDENDPPAAARREAMEETGLRLGTLEDVATVWTMPGISTERMTLYLAPYHETDRIGKGGGLAAENEVITVIEMPLAEVARLADSGELDDMKTLALVQTLRLRRPELFE
jgi:nudix-type nucleoside diphosphatase (YffH/AdpP family)